MVTAGAQETEAGHKVHSILGACCGGAAGSWGAYYDGSCGGSLVYDQSLGTPHSVTGFIRSAGMVKIFYLTWHLVVPNLLPPRSTN